MSRRFIVQLEDPETGDLHSWNGEAEESGHAVDLAREELDPEDAFVVTDVEEEV